MNALPIKMTKQILNIFIILLSSVFIWPCLGATQVEKLKRVTQELVAPPFLPKHDQVAIGGPKVVLVRLVVDQKEIQVAPDAWVQAMTFNGSVPGPMIVVHQNDYVELTLVNPSKNICLQSNPMILEPPLDLVWMISFKYISLQSNSLSLDPFFWTSAFSL